MGKDFVKFDCVIITCSCLRGMITFALGVGVSAIANLLTGLCMIYPQEGHIKVESKNPAQHCLLSFFAK